MLTLLLLLAAPVSAPAAGHAAAFTFTKGLFAGTRVDEGSPVLVRRYDKAKKKFGAPGWGVLQGVGGGPNPTFTVKSADGRTASFEQREITPPAAGDLAAADGTKFRRGQPVTVAGVAGDLTVGALFAPDFALLDDDDGHHRTLVRLAQLTVAGPPPAPPLPDLRAEMFMELVASEFELKPSASTDDTNALKFRPAESYYAGVGVGYKGIGASYAFSVPAGADTRAREGTSQYRDLRLSYYNRRFAVELAYNKYTSYLIDNSNTLSAGTLAGQAFYKLPNLTSEGYGANGIYVFSDGAYSLPAASDHSEIQEKSAGSLVAFASFRRQAVHNDVAIIPAEKQSLFGQEGTITGFRTFSYAAGPGYGYLWLPRWKAIGESFFVAPLLALSLGYETISEDVLNARIDSGVFGANVHFRLAFGWNSPGFFVVLSALGDAFTGQTTGVSFSGTQTAGWLTVGGRF